MKLIIFDFDGMLTPQRPASTAAFERILLDGMLERCEQLCAAGCTLAIATNQGGILKGLAVTEVEEHLRWVSSQLGVSAYRSACEPQHKKPNPVMLQELMAQFSIEAGETCLIGDTETDAAAATAAGIKFVHVEDFLAGESQKITG